MHVGKRNHTTYRTVDGDAFPPRYVNIAFDGKNVRTYFRKGELKGTISGVKLVRPPVGRGALLSAPGIVALSQQWRDDYFALKNGQPLPARDPDQPVEKGHVIPGSVDALIAHYVLKNEDWLAKSDITRQKQTLIHNKISEHLGQALVKDLDLDDLKSYIHKKQYGDPTAADPKNRKGYRGAARQLRSALRMLFEHARVELKWISHNPVADIKRAKPAKKGGWATMTEDEFQAMSHRYSAPASDERRFLVMDTAWGARVGDLLQLGWKNISKDGKTITFTPEKTEDSTGAVVELPVEGEELLAVLAQCPKTDTYFFQAPPKGANQWNKDKLRALHPKPWDYDRARKMWSEMREAAEVGKHCKIHSMRKLFATRMADAGASLTDIADALGDTEESARIYVQKRGKAAGAARAVRAVIAARKAA